MLLSNVNIIGQEGLRHIHIEKGRIISIANDEKLLRLSGEDSGLDAGGALAFPGLINSHDHLDFDLFPQTGNKIYQNYLEWGADIHRESKEQIDAVLRIPEPLRARWGVYKNLLAGVTTVVNHGKKLPVENELINVFQECQSIHSVKREKNWKFRLNRLYNRKLPVVIHIGEGTDATVQHEIDHLLKWNHFGRNIIGIHGVAMNQEQASSFKALIWCPVSNYFLLGQTAPIDLLKLEVPILFGTDSTLTASWNIWDHLRQARSTNFATDAELFDMLTINPARTWKLNDTGQLAANQWADIVVAKPGTFPGKWDAFYQLNPENLLLILHRGHIRLFDADLLNQVNRTNIPLTAFSKIYINGVGKYARGDVPGLMKEIRKYNPDINFPVVPG